MANRLTIKGQVTVPKEIRDFLGLRSGDSLVEFLITPEGSVSVVKASEAARRRSSRNRKGERTGSRSGVDVLSLLSGVCA